MCHFVLAFVSALSLLSDEIRNVFACVPYVWNGSFCKYPRYVFVVRLVASTLVDKSACEAAAEGETSDGRLKVGIVSM